MRAGSTAGEYRPLIDLGSPASNLLAHPGNRVPGFRAGRLTRAYASEMFTDRKEGPGGARGAGAETSASEAARRHGVSAQAACRLRDRFLDAGRRSLDDKVPGPGKNAGSAEERPLKLENNPDNA